RARPAVGNRKRARRKGYDGGGYRAGEPGQCEDQNVTAFSDEVVFCRQDVLRTKSAHITASRGAPAPIPKRRAHADAAARLRDSTASARMMKMGWRRVCEAGGISRDRKN